jgi:hypothetical protein
MSLQNPGALLWLIPLVGVIVVLYLLRMRRRDVIVPASFLWPQRVEEVRANALFQRLRWNWLMVLQILAVALLVFTLARPQTRQSGLAGEVTVLVLDTSASMGATDVSPSRFEAARRQVLETIQAAKPGDRLALIEAGPLPRVVFPLTSDPARQRRALETVQPTDAESDVGEAMRLASALVGGIDGARIVLLSDGCFAPIVDFSPGKAAVTYRRVGESGDNLAIEALGVAETPAGRQAYCGVRNYGLDARSGALTLFADGKPIDSVRFEVPGGKSWGRTAVVPAGSRVIEARIEAKDRLAADNVAYALAEAGGSLRVLLVGPGDFFLERALVLDPRVTLDKAPAVPSGERGSGPSAYDLVVFDGVPEEPVRARAVLTLGRAGGPSAVRRTGTLERPKFVDSASHPLMEGVDLDGIYIEKAEKVAPEGSAQTVSESDGGPLVVVRSGPKRQVYVAFSPLDSDFPLSVGFPIFVANALTFLAGTASQEHLVVRAGQVFQVPVPSDSATLEGPGDLRARLEAREGGRAMVREATRVGEYRIGLAGATTQRVYAQLRSETESNIQPADEIRLGGGQAKAVQSPARFSDFWRPLLLLGLAVLALEWWLFARRS